MPSVTDTSNAIVWTVAAGLILGAALVVRIEYRQVQITPEISEVHADTASPTKARGTA
jgi:hypothetical protein